MAAREQSPATSAREQRLPLERRTIALALRGPIVRADIGGLCERVHVLLEGSDAELVVCDLGAITEPDAATIDALARMQLTARRFGREVRLRRACGDLQKLLALMGLCEVVPLYEGSALESRRETEEREQACGVEEEGDAGDPIA